MEVAGHGEAGDDRCPQAGFGHSEGCRKFIDLTRPIEPHVGFVERSLEKCLMVAAFVFEANQPNALEIPPGQVLSFGQGMIPSTRQNVRVVEQRRKNQSALDRTDHVDAELDFSVFDALQSGFRREILYAQANERIVNIEFLHDGRQKTNRHRRYRRDRDMTALPRSDIAHGQDGIIEFIQNPPCDRLEFAARGGWRYVPGGTFEERRSQANFQRLNATRERRLREIQQFRRLAEARKIENGKKSTDVEQIKIDTHFISI